MNRNVRKMYLKKLPKYFLKRQKELTYQYEVGIYASTVSGLGMFGLLVCSLLHGVEFC